MVELARIIYKVCWILHYLREDNQAHNILSELVCLLKDNPSSLSFAWPSVHQLLALTYRRLNRTNEAVQILEQVVKVRAANLDKDDSRMTASLYNLAVTHRKATNFKRAIELLEQVVATSASNCVEPNWHLLRYRTELASCYIANKQVKRAISLLEEIAGVKSSQEQLTSHCELLTSQHELALAYEASGRLADAIKMQTHVVQIRKRTLPAHHPHRLVSEHQLALYHKARGDRYEAVKLMSAVVEIRQATLPLSDLHRQESERLLRKWRGEEMDRLRSVRVPISDPRSLEENDRASSGATATCDRNLSPSLRKDSTGIVKQDCLVVSENPSPIKSPQSSIKRKRETELC